MKKIILTLGLILIIGITIYAFNFLTLTQPTMSKINEDKRNDGITIDLHYKFYVIPNTLVFNLKEAPSDKAVADIFRVFLQTSSVLKDKKFNKIELKYKGTLKFILNGDYYAKIGSEFEEQNPVYTIRTFPENLYNPDGEASYSKWEGGMLRVFNKQMEDFNDFNKKWYLDEITSELQK
jgi:hypothetical protein